MGECAFQGNVTQEVHITYMSKTYNSGQALNACIPSVTIQTVSSVPSLTFSVVRMLSLTILVPKTNVSIFSSLFPDNFDFIPNSDHACLSCQQTDAE